MFDEFSKKLLKVKAKLEKTGEDAAPNSAVFESGVENPSRKTYDAFRKSDTAAAVKPVWGGRALGYIQKGHPEYENALCRKQERDKVKFAPRLKVQARQIKARPEKVRRVAAFINAHKNAASKGDLLSSIKNHKFKEKVVEGTNPIVNPATRSQ